MQALPPLNKLRNKELLILGELLLYDYMSRKSGDTPALSSEIRKEIAERLDITPEILRTNLSILRKHGLLVGDKLAIHAEYLEPLEFEFYEKK